jgi:hypothetical protein
MATLALQNFQPRPNKLMIITGQKEHRKGVSGMFAA